MNRRHQVFVSSTYQDLQEERQIVTLSLLEHNCIPVGMELFPAADHDPWKLIRKIIEESDYYMLILAGKYGSCPSRRKISFTEREYDYAVKIKKPIVVFLRDNLDSLTKEKIETEPIRVERLNKFREKVKKKFTIKLWNSTGDLKGNVSSSINYIRSVSPQPGWVPADQIDLSESMNIRIAKIEKEFDQLRGKSGKDIVTKFDNYDSAQAEMQNVIVSSLESNKTTIVRVLGVSLKYSWPMLAKIIKKNLAKNHARLRLEVAFVDSKHLFHINLNSWANKSTDTAVAIKDFASNSELVANSSVNLTVVQYANLPHWHGILINDNTLFLGRCNWELPELEGKLPKLFVGETTYRLFSANDLVGGMDRISLFNNWFRFYKRSTLSTINEYGERKPE